MSSPRYKVHTSQQSQAHSSDSSQTNHSPSRVNDLLILQLQSHVPNQMPKTVEAVEGEWCSHKGFESEFGDSGPFGEARDQSGGSQLPAEKWGDEVEESEGVDTAGEDSAGNTVEH